MASSLRAPHPGIVKIRSAPLLVRRTVALVALVEGRWRDLVARADVMSEGGAKEEEGQLVYYGSTSLLFAAESAGGEVPDERLREIALVARHDPHLRLRALRIAHREAQARAGAPLGAIRAEIAVSVSSRGVAVGVDVTAPVLRGRDAGRRRAASKRGAEE
jgi:hypothetical protein